MRKTLITLLCMCTLFTITACQSVSQKTTTTEKQNTTTNTQNKTKTLSIYSANLSDETKSILEFFDSQPVIYDVSVNDQAHSCKISLWGYEDKTWKELTYLTDTIEEDSYRIGIQIDKNQYNILLLKDNEVIKKDSGEFDVIHLGENHQGRFDYKIEDSTEDIELNKEVTLLYSALFASSKYETTDNFREAKCQSGYAVTLTLSDK